MCDKDELIKKQREEIVKLVEENDKLESVLKDIKASLERLKK